MRISAGEIATLALGRELDEAARQLDVAGDKRLLDLARRDRGIELLVERNSASRTGSSAAASVARGIDAARQAETGQRGEPRGDPERKRNGKAR